ncbi:type II toxin-antitoxin system PemK/MazF family toxin [Leifsonia sp. NPDC058194]|uniref:type II toxin-antitoxin system PemK/MazF family toxin n=1 Tax=Leifsonia sp. NPDC058194 TaxID=3346374 RepID=UPI0036DB914D
MRRGTVLLAQFDPALFGEASKTRPCIVVSNHGALRAVARVNRGSLVAVPLTTKVGFVHPEAQVLVDEDDDMASMGLSAPSKVQIEQIRAISLERVHRELGQTPPWIMHQVDDALRFHLSL